MSLLQELETFGYLFYIASPNKTSFQTVDEVPDYTINVLPYFILLYIVEYLVTRRKNHQKAARINDSVSSVSQGILSEITRISLQGWKLAAYIYVYENWRLLELPWNSAWTWWIAFLAVDFVYYWAHRASHEINVLWAAHQVHHSSEDYNLSTALRQSVVQSYLLSWFYLPMAFAVPPSAYLVHTTFNLLYQFWIHTELVKSLGPLEFILNTASHHRVHHGRNRYCIDKNYGGTLIIWDRIFGTFEPEKDEVVYGLTHPIDTFEPFTVQLCHFLHIWRTFWSTAGWREKLSVLFKGPGWSPGKPRLGCIEDIPDVHAPIFKYDPHVPTWCKLYTLVHIFPITLFYVGVSEVYQTLPLSISYGVLVYDVFSLSVLGTILDGRPYSCWLEVLRCLLYLFVDVHFLTTSHFAVLGRAAKTLLLYVLRLLYGASTLIWLLVSLRGDFQVTKKMD